MHSVGIAATASRTSRRIRVVLATLVLAGTSVVASTEASAADPARPAPASIDAAFVAMAPTASTQANVALYVNSHRRSRGLSALGTSGALTNAAQLQANYMASTGRMTHTGAGGTTGGDPGHPGRLPVVDGRREHRLRSAQLERRRRTRGCRSPPHAANMFNPSSRNWASGSRTRTAFSGGAWSSPGPADRHRLTAQPCPPG